MNARHKWGGPNRTEHKSERVCIICGLIKVSHHQGDSHWIDFWRSGLIGPPDLISSDRTPPCSGEVPFSG